ncbi:MAG: hypothetical protein JWL62_2377 [Hyphomicrobiales bacterium]|nr:hypothetical protein [Hyphomicrobiales bacterium]
MLGPVDLDDWTYDERDELSATLRRHDAVHAVVTGADARAQAFPPPLRALVCRFASQEFLGLDEIKMIVAVLPAQAARRVA